MSSYKRQMPQVTKNKISSSLTGRKLSDETKERISQSVKKAWARVPKDVKLWGTERNNESENNVNDEKNM